MTNNKSYEESEEVTSLKIRLQRKVKEIRRLRDKLKRVKCKLDNLQANLGVEG
nr:MAG TPA: hypothetical protein [Caudoviricetes sp.]